MKIYISGKITGLDLEEAKNNFETAEEIVKGIWPKAEVINPMKAVPYIEGKTWKEYMVDDISLLMDCDMIALLPNWEDSRGARVENAIAKEMNMASAILWGMLIDTGKINNRG